MNSAPGPLLFVYGSLKRGLANHSVLRGAVFVRECRTAPRYRLVVLGAYPALVDEGARAILGELYETDAAQLARLDAFEGDQYGRRSLELDDGRTAYAYFLASSLNAPAPWPRDSWP